MREVFWQKVIFGLIIKSSSCNINDNKDCFVFFDFLIEKGLINNVVVW